jgi:pimeloyl-ACP methyl ester carboxylesterase
MTRLPCSLLLASIVTFGVACGGKTSSTDTTPPRDGDGAGAGTATTDAPRTDGGEDLTLTTDDGVTIAATYWPGPAGSAECVIMIHQLSSKRAEWSPFVDALRGTVAIMTIDMRGHGASSLKWNDFTTEDWAAVEFDIAAAAASLAERGAASDRCVLFGSSIGSSAALRYTMAHPTIPGVVLLSPGLSYRGLDTTAAAKAFTGVALVARSHETGAEDAATYLERTWGDRVEVRVVDGDAHGVKLVAGDPGLVAAAVALVARAYGR